MHHPQIAGKLLYAVQLSTNLLKMKNSETQNASAPLKASSKSSAPIEDVNPDIGNTSRPSSDHQAARSLDCVTEIPPVMEEAITPRPLIEEEQRNPNASVADPDMPQTIEEAERAVLDAEPYLDTMEALRRCDRLSPRYARVDGRIDIHRRAYAMLRDAGILNTDAYCDALGAVANQRERKQKKV